MGRRPGIASILPGADGPIIACVRVAASLVPHASLDVGGASARGPERVVCSAPREVPASPGGTWRPTGES